MALHVHGSDGRELTEQLSVRPMFSRSGEATSVPKHRLPAGAMDPTTAYQIVHDHLMLDGNARLNLATFVTTWMEPEADRLMAECLDKNMIDKDEYPQTAELELRCVNILAQLWNAPGNGVQPAVGCSTIGSSEAAMFAGLALKRRWQQRRRAAGADTARPNLVMGINVQVCWDKFCNYFEVEPRLAPMAGERFHLDAEQAVSLCDENTIGVVAVLGSTFDGSYEPVAEIAKALDDLQSRTGLDVPVHVDGASGGMVAPFVDPDLQWDFRLPRVASINTSGHKYGLVYPGVGWVLWRDASALPEELIFKVNYLGGEMPTLALNFSRPGGQVVAQYYTFLRLGREGFRQVNRSAATSPPTCPRRSGSSGRSGCSPRAMSCPFSRSPSTTTSPTTASSTSPRHCGNVDGRCLHTPSPRIARTLLHCASWCVTEQVARWPTSCWTISHMCCPGCSSRPNRSGEPTRRASTTPLRNGRPDRAR